MTQTKAGRDPEGAEKQIAPQAQPDAGLLKALKEIDKIGELVYPNGADVMDTNPFATQITEIWRIASAAIAQHETGAAGGDDAVRKAAEIMRTALKEIREAAEYHPVSATALSSIHSIADRAIQQEEALV